MTREEIQAFSMRISQGNRTDLVVTTYDIILKYLDDGKTAFSNGDLEQFVWNIKKANEFLYQLMSALDLQYQVSLDLFSIYRYVQKMLIQAQMKRNVDGLDGIYDILKGLKESFCEAAKEDKSGPVMAASGQVYAGITYGKESLNEIYERNDGFQA